MHQARLIGHILPVAERPKPGTSPLPLWPPSDSYAPTVPAGAPPTVAIRQLRTHRAPQRPPRSPSDSYAPTVPLERVRNCRIDAKHAADGDKARG